MKKIIVIDDDITTRSLLKMLLEMEGYQIFIPSVEVEEIMSNLKSELPDMLFIDVLLQQVSGIDIVRQIRSMAEFKTIKILMTSGMDVKEECIMAGANGFLLKPFMPADLLAWIKVNTNQFSG